MIRATYRLQFHRDFTFADAARWAPYFADLGISHIYSSPILTARAGSMHGYDVVDHARINPELGGEEGFRALVATLREHGIGVIVDIVPNHVAVGKADNPWWLDLLKNGKASRYGDYFDIDWDAPGLEGKVFAPFLGDPPQEALAKGDLRLSRDPISGEPAFAYFEHLFPLRPQDRDAPGDDSLALLARQNFVLADWREADARTNWRRFFDVTELAAIRPGTPEVFEAIHGKILALYDEGLIQGVRVDHVDGLADPGAYCRKLRRRLEALRPGAYFVVEKILADQEHLPADWLVDGTTGYDFMNEVSALQHRDDRGTLAEEWRRQSGRELAFEEEEQAARIEVLLSNFAGQRQGAMRAFAKVLSREVPDAIDAALIAVIARLRCYRSYATGAAGSPGTGPILSQAFARAAAELPHLKQTLEALAALFERQDGDPLVMDALRRFSQLSAPVAAKAVEDTAFYRYGRLLSRNDVGFDPSRHAMDTAEFHRRMIARASSMPQAMLATATHDHKRGEDARARLAVLSYRPALWSDFIAAAPAPDEIDAADRYQLYQSLLGAWPQKPDREFAQRMEGWCRKYLREAKLRSAWAMPNQNYEEKFAHFARRLILDREMRDFRDRLGALLAQIQPLAQANSVLQTVLHLCAPGMPDLYQGTECEDFSLVDPDNRRPVDFAARARALKAGGKNKQTLIARLLAARRDDPELWRLGSYQALNLANSDSRVVAFTRAHGPSRLILLALCGDGAAEGEIMLDRDYRDILTARDFSLGSNPLKRLFQEWPAAVLYSPGQAELSAVRQAGAFLGQCHFRRDFPFGALAHPHHHMLAFPQFADVAASKRLHVHEHVRRARAARDEAIAFGAVEPFNHPLELRPAGFAQEFGGALARAGHGPGGGIVH